MTSIALVTVIYAAVGAAVFIAGYAKGVMNAVSEYGRQSATTADPGGRYWPTVCIAVFGSGLAVILLGVTPTWMEIVPLLSITSALVIGLAFFFE